ncbi:hypothetical protein HDU98_005054 [Podochytrium sp. JEL0797]|nr:hypothetical protein HDU98_005054 [Podochytrium sp. JEL0797]
MTSFRESVRLAQEGDVQAGLVLAEFFKKQGKGAKAVRVLVLAHSHLENRAFSEAQASSVARDVAMLYKEGCGDLPPSEAHFSEWLTKAAESDATGSCFVLLAEWSQQNKHFANAFKFFKKAAERDNPHAVSALATFHSAMIKEAIEDGKLDTVIHSHDSALLAHTEENVPRISKPKHASVPLDVEPEDATIHSWTPTHLVSQFVQHAQNNPFDATTLASLAAVTQVGLTIPKTHGNPLISVDCSKAVNLHLQAFKQHGDPTQLHAAAKLLYFGDQDTSSKSFQRDPLRAIQLFTQAAEEGCGTFLAIGDLIVADLCIGTDALMPLAFECYSKSIARKEHVASWIRLGDCWRLGRGCVKDAKEALRVYEEGVEEFRGDGLGRGGEVDVLVERVAGCFAAGEGCVKDSKRARVLMASIGK